ncbi:MAG TPA: lysophospholipid acyltransferase family protein [Thermoanaerobaculia bacterium]|nr:lysophospholipid acyltransferase family protein [Thermoanaerobaculia bacterium]
MSLPQEPAATTEPILSRLFWFPVNLLQAVLVVLWTAGGITLTLIVCAVLRRKSPGLTLARRVWAPGILLLGPVRLRVEGREHLDPSRVYFFVANHQSWVDIPALFKALPVPLLFLAKRELARIPFLGSYMEAMGMVYVDRADRGKAVRAVSQAAQRLREGYSILSFPEGTRSPDGRVQPFKTATFAAALEAGVPVVPVALEGPARILPRDGFHARPGVIRLKIGEPLPAAGLTRDDRADLARRAQEEVEGLLADLKAL